ncbi:MAG: hypothetical protein KC502_02225 [Myxococcales bacterium]|nr:hypothetical protein [Myxococcales bacterium]
MQTLVRIVQDWPVLILPVLWAVIAVTMIRGGTLLWTCAQGWQRRAATALTALSLGLRAWLSPWGWSDQNNLLSDGLVTPLTELKPSTYGTAIDALTASVSSLFHLTESFVEWLGLLSGGLTPLALVVAIYVNQQRESDPNPEDASDLRQTRSDVSPTQHLAPWAAGMLLATTPLHVRLSPMVGRYPLLLLLATVAIGVFGAHLAGRLRGQRGEKLLLLGGVCAMVLAVQCRPEAAWLVVAIATLGLVHRRHAKHLLPLVGLGMGLLFPHAMRLTRTIDAGEGLTDFDLGHGIVERLQGLVTPQYNLLLTNEFTPTAWVVLCLIGLVGFIKRRDRMGLWWATWAIIGTGVVGTVAIEGSLFNARYHMIPLLLYTPLAGAGTAWIVRLLPRNNDPRWQVVWVATAALPASLLMGHVNRVTANDAEVRFLRTALPSLPPHCTIFFFEPKFQDLGMRPKPSLSTYAAHPPRWLPAQFITQSRTLQTPKQRKSAHDPDLNSADQRRQSCELLYIGSACLTPPGWKTAADEQALHCGKFLQHRGSAVATAQLPRDTGESTRRRPGADTVGLYHLRSSISPPTPTTRKAP